MNKSIAILISSLLCATVASAHVQLEPAIAESGVAWQGAVHVGHGCDAAPTTSIDLKLPRGVTAVRAAAKPGWRVVLTPGEVIWTAPRGGALDANQAGDFPLELRVAASGPQWVKVLQRCQGASVDWSQVPAQGTSTEDLKHPAVLLKVMTSAEAAAWRERPSIEQAWVRASVPGQQATGAFMRITAKEPTQLVSVSSPVAGVAQVHEMKMEGSVMHMRPAGPVDLPVGRAFELNPGSYHVMLQDLKKPLEPGSSVPITLVFRNAKGVETRVDVRAPVALAAPGPSAAMPGMQGMAGMAHGDPKH